MSEEVKLSKSAKDKEKQAQDEAKLKTLETVLGKIEKSMYGRKYMGTERTTFVIGSDGRIERIIRGKAVNTKDHAQQILHED